MKARISSFEVGDLVYRQNTAHRAGLSRKLCPTFIGPYLVVEVQSPYLYRVEDRKRPMVLHHDKLKRCEDRAIPLWIQRRRQVLFEKDNQHSATDPDPEVDVAKSEIVPDELPFPEGVPIPEIPGLSSQLYQAQIGESQDLSSAPSLGGQQQVGEPGSGLM